MSAPPPIPSAPPRGVVRAVGALQRLLVRLARRLSPPHFAIMEMATSKWLPASLEVVANLGLADHVRDGPRDVRELAAAAGVHEESLYRVLRALARHGVFAEGPLRTFRQTALSRALTSDARSSMLHIVRQLGSDWSRACWAHLDRAVATGDPVFESLHDGVGLWEYLDRHPEQGENFHRSMVDFTRQIAGLIASCYDFSRFETVVDVGGGSGELLAVILRRHPRLRGVIFDLPLALKDAAATLTAYGVADRCELSAGSLFESVPVGHDAYLMKSIVHGMSDEKLETPLRLCREAMRADGRLLLVESVVPEPRGPYLEFVDLQMLLSSDHGLERTRPQLVRMLERHGFVLDSVRHTASPMSLIVARRNGPAGHA